MTPQFLIDKKGKKISVMLSFKDYEQLLEDSEELSAVKAYDKAKAKKETYLPLREAIRQRKQKKHA